MDKKARWRCAPAWIMGPHRSDTMTRLFGLELTNWTIFKCAPLFFVFGEGTRWVIVSPFFLRDCVVIYSQMVCPFADEQWWPGSVAIKILIGSRQRNCRAPGNWFVYGCRDGLDEERRVGTLSGMMTLLLLWCCCRWRWSRRPPGRLRWLLLI